MEQNQNFKYSETKTIFELIFEFSIPNNYHMKTSEDFGVQTINQIERI